MDLRTYENLITDTSENDWTRISCWGAGSGPSYLNNFSVWNTGTGDFKNLEIDSHGEYMSLKKDLLVSVAWGITHNENFQEDWANSFPDTYAKSSFVDFFYSGVLVFRDIYVSVDGGRCALPLPKRIFNKEKGTVEKHVISKQRYEFFRLLNNNNSEYDYYIKSANFEIIDDEWMVGDGY